MPQGLQVWDANGVLILDTTTRMVRVAGSLNTTINQAGSIQFDLGQGTPWYQVVSFVSRNYDRPLFTYDAATGVLSWTAASIQSNLRYGYF